MYRKSDLTGKLREGRTEKSDEIYTNPDNDPRGPWTSVSYVNPAAKEKRKNLVYKIKNPFTGVLIEHPTNAWKYKPETNQKHITENRLLWGELGGFQYPRLKKFLSEVSEGLVPVDLWRYDIAGTTDEGSKELEEILGRALFENPKPTKLIKKVISLFTDSEEEAIILDCFAGSGTTAQATLELNSEDNGNRQFILVQLDESNKQGELVNICETITAERVRRVIKGIPNAKKEALREGLGGTFSYFELGEEIEYNQFLTKTDNYPSWEELARFVFFNATGEQLDLNKCDPSRNYVGESLRHVVWLFYQPDHVWLRSNGFTLTQAEGLPRAPEGKRNLVFAPMKYVDDDSLYYLKVDYLQLPYEIYRMK